MLDQQEVNQLWEAVQRTSREVVWAVDAHGIMTFLGAREGEALGTSTKRFVGRDPFWMVHPQDVARAAEVFHKCAESKAEWRDVRLRLQRSDGSSLWVETSGIPHLNEEGELLGFTATTRKLDSHATRQEEIRVLRERIEDVLAQGRLLTVWQPIFSLSTGRVAGVEALTRFDHPVEQPPWAWFRDAHEVGLGTELELAAIRSALSAAGRLPEGVYLSLNASPAAVLSGELTTAILSAPIPADRIVLELTEHTSIGDYEALAAALDQLRARKVRLAVDDAGAGFASFRHILQLAPDIIKLDQSITQGITDSPAQRALASALVMFAGEVGQTTVVAEGIEESVDLSTLSSVGVHQAQGFYLGRPVGPESVDWLAEAIPLN